MSDIMGLIYTGEMDTRLRELTAVRAIAAVPMLLTYIATRPLLTLTPQNSPLPPPLILLLTRILLAATIYLGLLWLFGAKILKECIGFLFKKKKAQGRD